jgi:branched-chain amino acid transport system substrate-binding protein
MKYRDNSLSRCIMVIVAVAMVSSSFHFDASNAFAAPEEIKIGVIYPMSGAPARNGNLMIQGIKAAMGWVNDNGGIKSLGGAKLVPVIADTGPTVEGVASATERVCRDPDISIVLGSWASSYTMASTEITERLGIPQFSISYSDALSERNFKYGFYFSPPSSTQADLGLSTVLKLGRDAGQNIKTAMFLGDNNAASKSFFAACEKRLPGLGVEVIGQETWSMGTLTDATPAIQKVKSLNPDIVIFSATTIAECQMLLMKKKELQLKTPFVANGAWIADPTFQQIGADSLEGTITICAYFPNKLTPQDWLDRSLKQCAKEYSNEPYVSETLGYPWVMVPVIAEVLERAGSKDRQAIWKAARELDIHDVLNTRYFPKQGIAFDNTGRIAPEYREITLVQWQGGIPKTVYPPAVAVAKPIWVFK